MYGLHIPPSWEFDPLNPLIFLVRFKVNMFFLMWTKFDENLSIGFVLIYLTLTSLTGAWQLVRNLDNYCFKLSVARGLAVPR